MPGWWRSALVWGLATLAVAFFVAYMIVLHNEGERARRWRNALVAGAIVAAMAAGIVEVTALVRDLPKGRMPASPVGRYSPTSTAVLMS